MCLKVCACILAHEVQCLQHAPAACCVATPLNTHVQRARLVRPASAETDAASVTYSFSSNGASSNGTSASTAAAATSTVAAPAPQPSTPSTPSSSSSSSVVTSIKLQLLELVAALDRGRLAGHADKEAVERLVASLEGSGAGLAPFGGTPAPLEGRWELLYTNKEVFRAR